MSRYITLGADENGEVYWLELGEDGKWERNSSGLSTSCAVVRPMSREYYEYFTEDPESAKDIWQACMGADRTELGLKDWFKEYASNNDVFDKSFVFELLDDESNPTIKAWREWMNSPTFGDYKRTFREYAERTLVKSGNVPSIECGNDVYDWECSGWFPPRKPFVVEFAPKEMLEEYYAHLRKTCKAFEG